MDKIEGALEELKEGKMVIVVDDEDRENEGDLVMVAEKVSLQAVNFMIKEARGLVCVPMEEERLKRLSIPPMVTFNNDLNETAFTVSVDHSETTTGISANERALTIKKLIDPASIAEDFRRPGHVFPLAGKKGGVLKRPGHTEAAIDLARLAGCQGAGVICEIINDDGTMARLADLERFAHHHCLKIISIRDLIKYRMKKEKLVKRVAEAMLPTVFGSFKIIAYLDVIDEREHLALIKGDIRGREKILVRVHSECLTGDVFSSLRCDCGEQLARSLKMIERAGAGVLLYMRQEGRGIGLSNKIKAYALQEQGLDTVEANEVLGYPADTRDYGMAAQILKDLGLNSIRLITNNPEKIRGLEEYGLSVIERIPIIIKANEKNRFYLEVKQKRMGHLLNIICSLTLLP